MSLRLYVRGGAFSAKSEVPFTQATLAVVLFAQVKTKRIWYLIQRPLWNVENAVEFIAIILVRDEGTKTNG